MPIPQLPKQGVLDMFVGGGLLPYVHCHKIILESDSEFKNRTRVTVKLRLYEEKDKLLNSQWLSSLKFSDSDTPTSFLDSFFIQIVPIFNKRNITSLLPSNDPEFKSVSNIKGKGSVFVARQHLGDGALPRAELGTDNYKQGSIFPRKLKALHPGKKGSYEDAGVFEKNQFDPIKVSTSSLLGNLDTADALASAVTEGKIREEYKNGKLYYVIPFEFKMTFTPTFQVEDKTYGMKDLGFLFYTFLSFPDWLKSSGQDVPDAGEFYESLIIEGPPSTEIVFRDSKVAKTREAFVAPGGRYWTGAVHYHGEANPGPDGYQGWMVGERHAPGQNQEKLELVQDVPNTKIVDFRGTGTHEEPPDEAINLQGDDKVLGIGPAYEEAEAIIGSVIGSDIVLSPFQKENKKFLFPGDNDDEYSKLYISRDKDNNARGLFFVNFENMLNNNSHLFRLLSSAAKKSYVKQILKKSKILELKIYRDRVEKNTTGNPGGNEIFMNDQIYEGAPYLVGTISDVQNYKTPSSNLSVQEVEVGLADSYNTRFFSFSDLDVSNHESGLYRYRVELSFKDGTYEFLNEKLNNLNDVKKTLDEYYRLSMSGDNDSSVTPQSYHNLGNIKAGAYNKAYFKSYYDDVNGSFRDEFIKVAHKMPAGETMDAIWLRAPVALVEIESILANKASSDAILNFLTMLSPIDGTPQGIEFVTRVVGHFVEKLQSNLKATQRKKSSNELNNVTAVSVKNTSAYDSSPAQAVINEHHSFDHPMELFRPTANKDIFVDFLSIGETMPTEFFGMRTLSVDFFKNRCQLDAAKFSPLGENLQQFNDTTLAMGDDAANPNTAGGTLADQAYSYITPSIIELSSPGDNDSFDFNYIAFSPSAAEFLTDNAVAFLAPDLGAYVNYENLLIGLINNTMNKSNVDFANLSDAFHDIGQNMPGISTVAGGFFKETVSRREPYKKLFDNLNLTLHEPGDKYNSFFNKPSGYDGGLPFPALTFVNPLMGGLSVTKDYPSKLPEEFSDGLLSTQGYFSNFIKSDKQGIINVAKPAPYGPPKIIGTSLASMPNPYKLSYIFTSKAGDAEASAEVLRSTFSSALVDNSFSAEAFKFIHYNMLSSIEVFRGTSFPKNDDASWSLLTESDISSIEDQQNLFCRLKYYNEDSLKGVEIPVLDKYFFISLFTPSAQIPLPPSPAIVDSVTDTPALPGTDADNFASNLNFFMQQNQQKLSELSNLLNIGISLGQPSTPPGVKTLGTPTTPTPGVPQAAPGGQPTPNTGAPGGGGPGGGGGFGGGGGY